MATATQADVRGYFVVFGTLLALTLLTVVVSTLSLLHAIAIALGVSIAAAKATLVALFFMHLRYERALILRHVGVHVRLCRGAVWLDVESTGPASR